MYVLTVTIAVTFTYDEEHTHHLFMDCDKAMAFASNHADKTLQFELISDEAPERGIQARDHNRGAGTHSTYTIVHAQIMDA